MMMENMDRVTQPLLRNRIIKVDGKTKANAHIMYSHFQYVYVCVCNFITYLVLKQNIYGPKMYLLYLW